MYVDFSHLANFQYADPEFMVNLVRSFNKYEPNLRSGLKRFMAAMAYNNDENAIKKSYFSIAIYNLPQIT